MGITAPLRADPFFGGSSSVSDLVPYRFPVSLDGRPYMLDTKMTDQWGHETVPLLKPQADDTAEPGEQSLNPEALIRRSWTSWHKGAGQTSRDREDSNRSRFRASVGVDVWTRYELSLLNAVDQKRTSSNTNLKLAVCGSRLFLIDGQDCVYTEDITVDSPTWTACSGEPVATLLDIASDGKNVYITDGSDVYDAVGSGSPPDFTTAWSTQDVDTLAFVKGRLVGGHDTKLYTFSSTGVATEIVTTASVLPSTFVWVGFAGGPTTPVIYAAGFAGDKSLIFRIGIKEDGSGLDVAIPAAELPDGEIVRSIGSYLGFVLIGTDNGVRFATPDSEGNLTVGALLETGTPCRCFEGQGPFVWFGWDNYTESLLPPAVFLSGLSWTGLGRMSFEEFSSAERLAPAYATDLMSNATGATSSVATFQGRIVYCSEGTGRGVFGEQAVPTTGGYLVASLTDFGFTGNKTAIGIDLAYENPTGGTILVQVEEDDSGSVSTIGSITTASRGVESFGAGYLSGARFQMVVGLGQSSNASPVIRTVALKVSPAVRSARRISLPLLMGEWLDPDNSPWWFDVNEELNSVEGWWATRQPITLREFDRTYTVTVENFRWIPRQVYDEVEGLRAEGTLVVQTKEVA